MKKALAKSNLKRNLLLFLCLLLLFSVILPFNAFAEKTLQSYFEKLDGYKVDKFTKDWSYFQAWSHEYSDAYVVIGIHVQGDEKQAPPLFYSWIRDEKNQDVLYEVVRLAFLIDDKFYLVYPSAGSDSSGTFLTKEAKGFLEALSKANSVSVRLTGSRSGRNMDLDEDISGKEYNSTLKAAAKAILNSNIWEYVDSSWDDYTNMVAGPLDRLP